MPDSSLLYDAAEEAIAVIEALWDGTRRTEHLGPNFRSHGKMKGPYLPERPVFVCAAAPERGRRFTATHGDGMFASPSLLSELPTPRQDLGRHAAAASRPRAPEVLVAADLLIRDGPGQGKALFDDLMASLDNQAGKRWTGQIGKLRNERKTPLKLRSFAGTVAEVADQIIDAHARWGLNGVLFRRPLWSADELLRLGPVFDILERDGIWCRPASRAHSW